MTLVRMAYSQKSWGRQLKHKNCVFQNNLGKEQWERRKLQMVSLASDPCSYSISTVWKPEAQLGSRQAPKPGVWVAEVGSQEGVGGWHKSLTILSGRYLQVGLHQRSHYWGGIKSVVKFWKCSVYIFGFLIWKFWFIQHYNINCKKAHYVYDWQLLENLSENPYPLPLEI